MNTHKNARLTVHSRQALVQRTYRRGASCARAAMRQAMAFRPVAGVAGGWATRLSARRDAMGPTGLSRLSRAPASPRVSEAPIRARPAHDHTDRLAPRSPRPP